RRCRPAPGLGADVALPDVRRRVAAPPSAGLLFVAAGAGHARPDGAARRQRVARGRRPPPPRRGPAGIDPGRPPPPPPGPGRCRPPRPGAVVGGGPGGNQRSPAGARRPRRRVRSFDAHAATPFPSELVVNPLLGPGREAYEVRRGTQVLLGARYAVVRPEIRR